MSDCPKAPAPRPGDLDVETQLSRGHLMRLERSDRDREIWRCARLGCDHVEIRRNPFARPSS